MRKISSKKLLKQTRALILVSVVIFLGVIAIVFMLNSVEVINCRKHNFLYDFFQLFMLNGIEVQS
jgi:hypothetical protein